MDEKLKSLISEYKEKQALADKAEAEAWKSHLAVEDRQKELVLDYFKDQNLDIDDLEIGTWDCHEKTNPIGVCVYNQTEDRCLDECLFCGHPAERK